MILFVEIPRILFPIVVLPVVNTSPSGLSVIPDPTRVFDLNVAIPATSRIPVSYTHLTLPTICSV